VAPTCTYTTLTPVLRELLNATDRDTAKCHSECHSDTVAHNCKKGVAQCTLPYGTEQYSAIG